MAKVIITIDCDTQAELLSHLDKIKEDIISKKKDGDFDVHDLRVFHLDDSNCYGDHSVEIFKS